MAFLERFRRQRVSDEDLRQKSDKYLILAYCKDGNLDFVSILFSRYIHLVFGCCLKHLENEENAKDTTMAVFEKLCKELKTHGPEIKEFRPWLYVLTKNLSLMRLRKASREQTVSSDESGEIKILNNHVEFEGSWHPIDENDEDLEDKLTDLEECLGALPEHQQVSIREFYFSKRSYAEISKAQDIPVNKVKSYIQNGKRNLRKCVESKHSVSEESISQRG